MRARVTAVSSHGEHSFSKPNRDSITLVEGYGIRGDAHAGATVQHLSRVARDATQPNLRQVHLMHEELFHALGEDGFTVGPGDLGENITTRGIDLLALPTGTVLRTGADAALEVTGLRNPCRQIERFRAGLLNRVLRRDDSGTVVRLSGIMTIVRAGGAVRPGDTITVELPDGPHRPLDVV